MALRDLLHHLEGDNCGLYSSVVLKDDGEEISSRWAE